MPKSKLMQIILIVGSVLIIVGVLLMAWMLATEKDRSVIEVDLGNRESQPIKFDSLSLLPGEKCEYTVKLKKSGSDQYDLSLRFVETEEKTLKNYVRVKIIANDETVCDKLLAEAFKNENIILPVDFTENKNTELKIVYYLPLDVGNEAKNAEAIFELILTANDK